MITWACFFITIALIVYYLVLPYRRLRKIIDLIPGPKPWPVLGNVPTFQGSKDEVWIVFRKLGDIYYPIYRFWTGLVPMINIRHPDDIGIILGNPELITKDKVYTFFESWFGTGLLTSNGAKWKKRRNMLTPAFHFTILQEFVEVFIGQGELLSKSLKKEGEPVVKDLLPLISEYTLNVICETAMGISLQDKGELKKIYSKAVDDMLFMGMYRIVRPWLHFNFIFGLVPTGWHQTKLLKVLHGFTKRIISERKALHDQTGGRYLSNLDGENVNPEAEHKNDLGIRKRRLAMLDLLLVAHQKNQIDNDGIREEVDTFIFAGHDTSALCVSYTIMLLAEHKEIQARARAEVNAVLEENDGKMSFSALQRLPYLERCIKESLRLYPSVHGIGRQIQHTVRLTKYEIPKDTAVFIHIADVHRDANFWPEPEVFDPDRFLPEKIQGRHPYSYIPFSAGARNCIGQRFAMLELKAFIGILLQNFFLEPFDNLRDVRFIADLTMKPAHPMRAKFIPIK